MFIQNEYVIEFVRKKNSIIRKINRLQNGNYTLCLSGKHNFYEYKLCTYTRIYVQTRAKKIQLI